MKEAAKNRIIFMEDKMSGKSILLRLIATMLIFGMAVLSCDKDSPSEGGIPKTLVITDLPSLVYDYASSGGLLGVFKAGTTPEEAQSLIGVVAGADMENDDIIFTGSGPYTLAIPLWIISGTAHWTGSGTYDVYVHLYGDEGHFYRAVSVPFIAETTYISFDDVEDITP